MCHKIVDYVRVMLPLFYFDYYLLVVISCLKLCVVNVECNFFNICPYSPTLLTSTEDSINSTASLITGLMIESIVEACFNLF